MPASLLLTSSALFTRAELDRYEAEILASSRTTEHAVSEFFQRYPKFLYLGHGSELRREVVLIGSSDTPRRRVDFFRRSYGSLFWDIVELKSPGKPFLADSQGAHVRLSADVEKAISQGLDYRDLIVGDSSLRSYLAQRGIAVLRPQLLAVVGRRSPLVPIEAIEILRDRVRQRGPIDVWSYDDIFDFAKEHYERSRLIIVPSLVFHRNVPLQVKFTAEQVIDKLESEPHLLSQVSPDLFADVIELLLHAKGTRVRPFSGTSAGSYAPQVREGEAILECRNHSVGIEVAKDLLEAMAYYKAQRGILVTSGEVSIDAVELLSRGDLQIEVRGLKTILRWASLYSNLNQTFLGRY